VFFNPFSSLGLRIFWSELIINDGSLINYIKIIKFIKNVQNIMLEKIGKYENLNIQILPINNILTKFTKLKYGFKFLKFNIIIKANIIIRRN
jgi:hypothetical protein